MRRIISTCLVLTVVVTGVQTRANGLSVWPANRRVSQTEYSPWKENSSTLIVRGNDSDCADGCAAACEDDCCDPGSWLDNTELFLGGDAYAALGDFPLGGFGNNFGLVSGFN